MLMSGMVFFHQRKKPPVEPPVLFYTVGVGQNLEILTKSATVATEILWKNLKMFFEVK